MVTRKLLYLFCLTALFACSKQGGGDEPEPTQPINMTIMSFNLRSNTMSDTGDKAWDVRKDAIKKMMDEIKPAVVGMQEATTQMRKDLNSLLSDYIMKEVPNTGTSKGGNTVIMYRTDDFELLESKSFYLSSTPNIPSVNGWNDETQYRTTIWVKLKHKESNQVIYFADTHMPLNKNTREKGILARNNSATLNVTKLKDAAGEDARVFIVGDMNCNSDDSGLQNYKPWLKNGRETALQKDDILSFNNYGGTGQSNLDHIFYKNVIANKFKTINKNYGVSYISDHYPVILEVSIL